VQAALRGQPRTDFADILTNQEGPLWYRGLALNADETERANVDAVLAQHGVAHVVLGHTKRASTVFPRFGGRVVLTDIAVPTGYADPRAFLIQENGVFITVHRGHHVTMNAETPAQTCAYLAQVAAIDPPGGPVATLAGDCTSLSAAAQAQ
jgi:hypothetical protein